MATNAPVARVDRVTLIADQKAARSALFYVMADAIDALLKADGVAYTKIKVSPDQATMMGGQP